MFMLKLPRHALAACITGCAVIAAAFLNPAHAQNVTTVAGNN